MKALIISGGGDKGAWGAGLATKLAKENKYDLIVGTSTGALIAPLIAAEKYAYLKQAYTQISVKDIFKINPFNKKGKIKVLNALYRLLKGKTSIGDSSNLRDRINYFMDCDTYEKVANSNTKVIITMTNVNTGKVEYYPYGTKSGKLDNECLYAASCTPVIMDLVKIKDHYYTDGGLIENTAIEFAIKQGATDIDVIVHNNPDNSKNRKVKNAFDLIGSCLEILIENVWRDDIKIGQVISQLKKNVDINYYYFKEKNPNKNNFTFDPIVMDTWYTRGFYHTEEPIHVKLHQRLKAVSNQKKT